jgi:lysozyme
MPTPIVADIYHGDVVTSFEEAYKDGIRGIIHKATQGATLQDKKYKARQPQAIDADLLWGAYHFGTGEDVDDQVSNFLDTVGDTKGILLALDFEANPNGKTMSLKQARQFLEAVYDKTGQRPVLYSGNLIKEQLEDDSDGFWGKHRLWLCQYGPKAKLPDAWDSYWLWQYTGDGVGPDPHGVRGIQGDVDLNAYDGSEDDLKAQWTGVSADTPVSTNAETTDSNEKTDDLPWMIVAKALIGVKEEPGDEDNQDIIKWARSLGLINDYNHDSIPWCGLFMAHVMSEAGEDVPDSPLWALSWKAWGSPVQDSAYGAVLVFKRQGGGHVGLYVSEDDDYYHVLGGNQSDMVCVKKVSKANCVGMRWPSDKMDLLKIGAIEKELDEDIISSSQMT